MGQAHERDERPSGRRRGLRRPVLVTLSTLMYEVALTRIFSVTMWYHFAFVAISVALFGMTVGALHRPPPAQPFTDADVGRQSVALLAARSPSRWRSASSPSSRSRSIPRLHLAGAWSVVLTCVVISVPFVLQRRRRLPGAHAVPAPGEPPLRRRPDRRRPRLRAARGRSSTGSTGRASSSRSVRWPPLGVVLLRRRRCAAGAACVAAVAVVALGGFAAAERLPARAGRPAARGSSGPRRRSPTAAHATRSGTPSPASRSTATRDALQRPSGVGLSRKLPAAEQRAASCSW